MIRIRCYCVFIYYCQISNWPSWLLCSIRTRCRWYAEQQLSTTLNQSLDSHIRRRLIVVSRCVWLTSIKRSRLPWLCIQHKHRQCQWIEVNCRMIRRPKKASDSFSSYAMTKRSTPVRASDLSMQLLYVRFQPRWLLSVGSTATISHNSEKVTILSHTTLSIWCLLRSYGMHIDHSVAMLLPKTSKQRTIGALDINGMLSEGGWIGHCCLSSTAQIMRWTDIFFSNG